MEKYRTGALKAIKNVKRKRCRSSFQIIDGRTSWESCFTIWASGLGLRFDGVILGRKMYHHDRQTKKRRAPVSNINVISAKELTFEDEFKIIPYTTCGQNGASKMDEQVWYRGSLII